MARLQRITIINSSVLICHWVCEGLGVASRLIGCQSREYSVSVFFKILVFHLELVPWLINVAFDLYFGLSFMHELTKVCLILR